MREIDSACPYCGVGCGVLIATDGERITGVRGDPDQRTGMKGKVYLIGVPAALGIPVTHRDVGRGVTFLTGHSRDDSEPDWRALRATGTTLVIYMGMTRVTALVAGMLEAGFPADTPACAIQNGTLVSQREVVTTLNRLPAAVAEARLGSPAILVIGEVVRYERIATALPAQRVA